LLSQISGVFFLQFSVGILLFMLFMPLQTLKNGFVALNTIISLIFLALAASLFHLVFGGENVISQMAVEKLLIYRAVWWLVVLGMIALAVFYFFFLIRKYAAAHIFLIQCVVVTLSAVFLYGMAGIDGSFSWFAQFLGSLSLILGAVLLGGCYGTMILGHWYLVTPKLPFKYLINSSRFLVATTVVRALVLGVSMALFFWMFGEKTRLLVVNAFSFNDLGLFFMMRIFWGIIGPLVLSFMILETAKIRSNQAATGILYVACIFVFIGELVAGYIFHLFVLA